MCIPVPLRKRVHHHGLQMYSGKCLIFTLMSLKFFFKSLRPRETQVSFLEKKQPMSSTIFIKKPSRLFKGMFQKNEERLINLALKKQQKTIQLPPVFLNKFFTYHLFVIYSFFLFMKISQACGRYLSMLFLPPHEGDLSLLSAFN